MEFDKLCTYTGFKNGIVRCILKGIPKGILL